MDVLQSCGNKLLYHSVIVIDKMGFMVVVKSLLYLTDLMVGESDCRKG